MSKRKQKTTIKCEGKGSARRCCVRLKSGGPAIRCFTPGKRRKRGR